MSKEINININNAVEENRQPVSQIGSLLGRPMLTVEARSVWAGGDEGFEKDKTAIAGGSADFIINRPPRKLSMRTENITSVEVVADPVMNGQVCIQINGDDGILIPLTDEIVKIGEVTPELVAAALNGNKQQIFLNAEKLNLILSRGNQQEADALQRLITKLSAMRQTILNANADNDRKTKTITDQWTKSAVTPDMKNILSGKAQGIVEVNIEQ